jgi:hypothetical protein
MQPDGTLVCRYCGEYTAKTVKGRGIHEGQWCPMNAERHTPFRGLPLEERFWAKVRKTPDCWLWTGSTVGTWGYGQVSIGRRRIPVHRYAYELLVGPIPDGLVIDHLCRVPHCVNPAHLEPVTEQVNILRGTGITAVNATKTACIHGHLFTAENTYIWHGKRICRACVTERDRRSS